MLRDVCVKRNGLAVHQATRFPNRVWIPGREVPAKYSHDRVQSWLFSSSTLKIAWQKWIPVLQTIVCMRGAGGGELRGISRKPEKNKRIRGGWMRDGGIPFLKGIFISWDGMKDEACSLAVAACLGPKWLVHFPSGTPPPSPDGWYDTGGATVGTIEEQDFLFPPFPNHQSN